MKAVFILLLVGLLVSFVLSDESKDLHHKKKHNRIHKHAKHGEKHTKKIISSIPRGKHAKRIRETIKIDLGDGRSIRGIVNETVTGKATTYYHFQGIRYGRPPVGDLRFEPPQPYEFKGRYDALYERDVCLQNVSDSTGSVISGSEDCLFLNVYTPSKSNSSKLAVLVWIYGGGFTAGSGNYESYRPDNFIDQGLVVVTMNYRLGVFGFMSTGDTVVPGNMGLKDQRLALKWVHDNIIHFGGDPNNVAIMGQSAGGASATYLVQSPSATGLFQKAIAHSVNSLSPLMLSRYAVINFYLLADGLDLKCYDECNNTEIVKRMKKFDAIRLLQTSSVSANNITLVDPTNGLVYAPVMEPPNPTELFSAKSFEQLDSGNFTKVPILMGYNSEEGKVLNFSLKNNTKPRDLVPLDMNVNTTVEKDNVGEEIKELYFGNGSIENNRSGIDKYVSHDFFVRPTVKYIELFSKWVKQTYLYRFSYSANSSEGVGHEGELKYFFYQPNLTPAQRDISNKVVKLWCNFIKTGNPTPSPEFNVTWIASSSTNDYSYLDIGENFVNYNQSKNPDKYYLDKWEGWYNQYGNRPFDTY